MGLARPLRDGSPPSREGRGDAAKGPSIRVNGYFNHPAELAADAGKTTSQINGAHPFLRGREGGGGIVESRDDCLYGRRDPL
jgi:hypothetical protein